MSMMAPNALVTGAPRIPLPYGLFSVLAPREDSQDRWQNGIAWETLTCDAAGGIGAWFCETDDEKVVGLPKSLDKMGAELGDASAFTVYGHYTCSPIGNGFDFAQEMANRHLYVREEARVEQALWTGDLGNVPNFAGANGYPALFNAGAFTDGWEAVSHLEQVIAERYGSQGVMHMNRELASLLTDRGELKASGARLVTGLGTPVIAGTGYGAGKIVVTPGLFGYRSEVFTSSEVPGDLLDRAKNNLYAIAERSYVLGFDPCGGAYATLTLPEGA